MNNKIITLWDKYRALETELLELVDIIHSKIRDDNWYKEYITNQVRLEKVIDELDITLKEVNRLWRIENIDIDLYKVIDDTEREVGLENISQDQNDKDYKWYKVYQSDNKKLIKFLQNRYYLRCVTPEYVNLYIDEDLRFYICCFKNDSDISGLVKLGEISGRDLDNSLLDCINIMRKM